jgi:hypothetical protein
MDGEEYDDSPWTDEERDQLRCEAYQMLDSFGKDTGRSTAATTA